MNGATQMLTVHIATTGETRDVEGRKVQTFTPQTPVLGNRYEVNARQLRDGLYVTVTEHKALLPPGTVIGRNDVLVDADGTRWHVDAARPRRGPAGVIRHVSCDLRREDTPS